MKKGLLLLMVTLMSVVMMQAQICEGPTGLTATPHVPDYRNVTLTWTPVTDTMSQVVSLSDPITLSTRIGWGSGSASDVVPTSRFLPSELAPYHGHSFTAVKFAPGVSTSFATFTIMIWQGGSMNPLDTSFTPGTLIYSQPVDIPLTAGVLNTIPLNTPITIDSTQELWVGVHIVTLYGYPIYASSSDGSHHNQTIVGNSSFSSWHALTLSSGSEYTWCIGMSVTNNPNALQGYRVYCNQTLLTPTPTPNCSYVDSLTSNGTFQYDVTAVYANGCESASITDTVTMEDDTCMIFELPFTENFDSYTGTTSGTTNNLPECWHHIAGTYASYAGYPIIYSTSSYASSTPNSLRFYTTTSSTDYGYQVAILPPMDIMSYPMNSLQIEFDGRASATTSNFTIVVGIMDNYFDLSTFVPIDTFTSSSTSYTNFLTDFSSYTGNGAYIALMAPRDFASNYGYLDNIVVDEIPSCPKPRDITSTVATQTSVTLTWNEMGSAAEWEIEYGPSGFTLGTGTRVQAVSNTTTVTGLSASLCYDFYVRSVCGYDDTSKFSGPFVQSTECGTISQLPYSQNFDAYAGSTTSTSNNLSQFCWSHINTGTSYSGYPIAYNSSTYSNSGLNSLRFYTYYTTAYSDQYAVMPAIDANIPINTLMLEYSAQRYSTYPLEVIIGVMSDSSDVTTFVPVDTLSIPTTQTVMHRDYITIFNQYTGTGRFIAFKAPQPTSSYNAGTIDDIVLSVIPSCMHPFNINLSNITSDAVTVDWEPLGSESSWEVAVVPAGAAPESNFPQMTTDHPFTVSMLTAQTEYDVYVRAYCGGSDYSSWQGPESFQTRCEMTSDIPYVENFDSYGTTTTSTATAPGPKPTCWDRYTDYTSPYPYISSAQHATGVGSFYFYASASAYSMALSQPLDLSTYTANSLMLSFKTLRTSTSYGRLSVGIMTNPDSMETFVSLKEIYAHDYTGTAQWEEHHVVLPEQYNTPVYLAFISPKGTESYVYLDEVILDVVPTCSAPMNFEAEHVASTSAYLTWENAQFGATGYSIEYSESGLDSWSAPISVTGTSYMLTGLFESTLYDVRIYSDCNSESSDTVQITFTTTCRSGGGVNFDDGTATTYLIPINNYYRYSYTQQLFLASEMSGATTINSISFDYAAASAMTSKNSVNIYMGHTTESEFGGPSDYISVNNLQLVYSGPLNCHQGWNTFQLNTPFQYNGTDNLVLALDDNSNAYDGTAYTFHYKSQTPDYKTIYFYSDSNNPDPTDPTALSVSSSRSLYRCNVRFGGNCDSTWTCVAPNVYVSSITSNEVVVNWAAGDSESNWAVEYMSEDDLTWTSNGLVSNNTYTFSNLTPGTQYHFRVCSVCYPDSSEWREVSAFVPCNSISMLPYTQGFESASGSGSSHTIDPCLYRVTNSSTAYPYPSSTYSYNGSYALYLAGLSSAYSYLALPRIDESIQIDSLLIQFQALKTSANYYVEVGILTDPNDVGTFTLLGSFSPSQTSSTTNQNWEMMDVTTSNYTGTGRYIAFRIPQWITSYIYIDDILVDYIPSCMHVRDMQLTNVDVNSAEISWTPGQDEQTWVYAYGLHNTFSPDTVTYLTTTSNPLMLTGLASNTTYDVFVAADCNEPEPSQFMRFTFTTLCDPIASLPYFENFDEYGGVSGTAYYHNCWYRNNTYSTTSQYPYLYTTYSHSAPQSLYFYSSTSTYCMAVTQEIVPTIDLTNAQVRFQYRIGSASNYLVVGVVTDPEDPDTFTALDTVTCSATSVFEEKTVSLAGYTGTGRYIAFKGVGSGYFDDLWIEEIPNCDMPTEIVFSNVSTSSVTLSWTEGDSESEWEVYVFPEGSSMTGVTPYQVNGTPSVNITGLNSATTYNVLLRAVCPGGTGYSSFVTASFTTACEPFSTIPYAENFDGVTGTTSTTVNNLPICWSYINTGTSYVGYPLVYKSTSYAESGENSLRFYVSSASSYSEQYAIMPNLDVTTQPLSNLELSFGIRQYSTSYPFVLVVGVMSDPMDTATFTPIDTLNINTDEYEPKYIYFNNYTGTGSYITFLAPKPNTGINYGHIDNIVLSAAPTCRPVKNIHFTDINESAATVAWTSNGYESTWVLEYRQQDAMDSTWQSITVGGSPTYTLSGLTANTTYEIRVQADCGSGDYSIWSPVQMFTTECNPLSTLPFSTNFDNYTGSTSGTTNNLPACWHYLNTGTLSTYIGYPIIYNSSTYAESGENSLRFYTYTSSSSMGDQYAILPCIDTVLLPINTLQVQFDVRKYSTSYATFTMIVGVMSDPNDENTFVPVDSVVSSETTYVAHTSYLSPYTGGGSYIALKVPQYAGVTYNSGYVDNLSISLMPQCPPASNVTASNITSTSADITWTPNGTETAWWVRYSANTSGAVADSVYVMITPTVTLTNLDPNTTYEVDVRSECDNGETSTFSTPEVFTTECLPITTLPYTENFTTYSHTTNSTTVPNLSNCWEPITTGTSSYKGYPYVYYSTTYAQSTPYVLRFYTYTSSTYGDQYAVLPAVDVTTIPMNTIQISFGARKSSSTYSFNPVIGVMEGTDITTFTPVDTVEVTALTYSTFSVNLSSYTGTGNRIAIVLFRPTSSYAAGYIDDVVLDLIPCTEPESLAVSNIGANSADVTWTPVGMETSWNLQYKAASSSSWSLVSNLTTPSYTLTNLQANTAYQVQVQADCGGEESDWTASATFTTMDDQCAAPTNLHLVDTTNVTATLDWNQSSGVANEWTINYRKTSEDMWSMVVATTHPYELIGLEPGVSYTAQVVAHCTNDLYSDPSTAITFTTSTVGVEDYELSQTEIFPNPTTGAFTIQNVNVSIESVEVYDVYGKIMSRVDVNDNTVTVDATQYAAGVYIARIMTEKGMVTRRIVKK